MDTSTTGHKLENMARFLSETTMIGSVVEIGVWRGGSLHYLASRCPSRQFYGYDTFEGMPPESDLDNHHKKGHFGDTSFEQVESDLSALGNVKLVRGLYPSSDVIKPAPIVMAHVDVDIYESTINALEHLAPMMVPNGRIYCDDAFLNTCHGATIAVCEFCGRHKKVLQFDLGSHACICM